MAWRLTQNGTIDQTDAVRRGDNFTVPELTLERNVRGRLTFDLETPTRPAAYSTWQLDGRNGAPRFGGYLTRRTPIAHPAGAPRCYRCEVTEWAIVGDWFTWTKTYDTDVSLATVLGDLVGEKMHTPYGVTLSPSQVPGPMIAAGTSWTARRGSDVLRDLVDQTGYMYEFSPTRVLRMFPPGADVGPVALSEATNIADLTWEDAAELPPTTDVVCWFGPSAAGERLQTITADGVARAWTMDVAAVPGAATRGYVTMDSINYPLGPGLYFEFDTLTSTLSVNPAPEFATPPAGTLIELYYNAQYPYAIRRSTGGSPLVEQSIPFPTVVDYAQASAIADQQLAVVAQAVRVFRTTTLEDGFSPGQATSQDAPSRDAAHVTIVLTRVSARLETDLLWEWLLEGEEATTLQPDYNTDWRRLVGAASSGAVVSGVAGGGGSGGGDGGGMLPLSPANVYVGSSLGVAASVPMTGDVRIATGGATTVVNVANGATTATPANVPNAIIARSAAGGFFASGMAVDSIGANTDLILQPTQDLHLNPLAGTVYVDPRAGHAWLKPSGFVILDSQGTGNYILPGTPYQQQIGAIHQKFLTLHAAELWVETLVAQQTMATIGGRMVIAPTNILTRDCAPADTTITVKYNSFLLHEPGVELGSKLIFESAGRFEAMVVMETVTPAANTDGSFTYTVQRNNDGSGANLWYAGDSILDTGKYKSGFIDLYSMRGLISNGPGPTIVGNVRQRATGAYNDIEPRWAIGNLNLLYGYTTDTYGAAFGVPSGTWLKIDPDNGVRMGHGSTIVTQIDAAGNASFAGTITSAAGSIGGWNIVPNYLYTVDPNAYPSLALNAKQPAIEIGNPRPMDYAQPGIWMGYSSGTYKFSVCNAGATVGFFFDGTNASFRGDGPGVTNINGGNIQTGTVTATQIAANTITGGQIAADTITSAHLAAGSVTASELAAGAITAGSIAARSITGDRLVIGAVTATEIAANTITASRIAAGTITGTEIQGGTITADKMSVGALSAISANLGTVTAGAISGTTITGATITGVSISGSSIVAGSGNTITLDASGLNIAEGNGGGSARINLGGKNMWGASGRVVFGSDVEIQFATFIGGGLSVSTMPVQGSGRAVYWHGDNTIGFWSGAFAARADVRAWDPPADRFALLDVPIVSYAGATGRQVGWDLEALAAAVPAVVIRAADGAPEDIDDKALAVYLAAALGALETRVTILEGDR